MAVDTRNKRASVLGLVNGLALVLPAPDAAVAQPDRQHVAYSYAGISASAGVFQPAWSAGANRVQSADGVGA